MGILRGIKRGSEGEPLWIVGPCEQPFPSRGRRGEKDEALPQRGVHVVWIFKNRRDVMAEEQSAYNAGGAANVLGRAGDRSPAPGTYGWKKNRAIAITAAVTAMMILATSTFIPTVVWVLAIILVPLWLNPERSGPVNFGPSRGPTRYACRVGRGRCLHIDRGNADSPILTGQSRIYRRLAR